MCIRDRPKKMSKTPDQAEEFNVYSYLKQLIDGNDVSVLLLISLLTRFSLFTWLGLVLLVLCYYRSLSRNISKRTEENYQYYALKDRVDLSLIHI